MKLFSRWLSALLFAVFAFLLLVLGNGDYLHAVSEHSIFLHHSSFFKELMAAPGGFIAWVGCYLTQFFHIPAIGALLLIALWLLSYFLTLKAFSIKNGWGSVAAMLPMLALLASVVSIGYWLYYMKIDGYWFKETLGYLLAILAILIHTRVTRVKCQFLHIVVWTIVGYYLAGWWALLGTLTMVCYRRTGLLARIAGIISIAIVPLVAYFNHAQFRLEEAWMYGFPLFENDKIVSWPMLIPFAVIVLTLIVLSLVGTKPAKNAYLPYIALIAAFAVVYVTSFRDENYHKEIRMYRAAMEMRWTDVLKDASTVTQPTREIVMLKDLALMQRGIFGKQYTKYSNYGLMPKKFDHLNVHLTQMCGPLIYLHYGRANMATRWAMENEVEYGMDVDCLKCLTLSALISEEWTLAEKYLALLEATDFQDKWVQSYRDIVNRQSLDDCKGLAFAKTLHDACGNILDTDKGMVEIYLVNYFSHLQYTTNKLLSEVILNFTCIGKDTHLFWPRFAVYVKLHQGEPMPDLYQEAALLYGNLEDLVDISHMPFDKGIRKRYDDFQKASQAMVKQGKNEQQIGQAMQATFGDTFWWNYYFLRNVQSY